MSVPAVTITELDGALGVLPAGAKLVAIVGACDSGPANTPAAFARTKDIVNSFSAGPAVEASAHFIENTGRPVVFVRTGNSVAGTKTTIDVTGVAGTSVVTESGTAPNDDYEPYFVVLTGGTIGTAGITFQWSLDNGRTLSAATALGTANTFTFPASGGQQLSFAAGTLLVGDKVRYRAVAPNWNSSELGAALTALKSSQLAWDIAHIVGPIDATAFDAIGTAFSDPLMSEKCWIGSARIPDVGESDAAYQTSLAGIFGAKATTFGGLGAGSAKTTSGISFRQYLRPVSWAACMRLGSNSEEIDIAAIDLGALQGIDIRDVNGNPDQHDELINPGLDDLRFISLRTFPGIAGVYVNNPRLFSQSGSDFEFFQHRRVLNLAKATLRIYFQHRLSKPILVNKTTGLILETEALEIESGAVAALRATLRNTPKCSDVSFALSRTDNLLSTKTLTGQGFIVPLAYPKAINLEVGFRNPALQVVAV